MFSIKYRYLFIFLLALYSYLNIQFTVGEKLFDFQITSTYLFAVLSVVVFGVWELNRLVEVNLTHLQAFLKNKVHPLIVLFLLSMVNAALVSTLTLFVLYAAMSMPLVLNFGHLILLSAFAFRVNLFLNCVNAIVFFMDRLKKTQLEAERLKKISIEAQFEALRNQINPHFLFNCFNVLSTLVYRDADTSAKFIAQLSNVYRYLLYNQDKRVVPLKEELAFLESYRFLLEIRFGENLVIENNIAASDYNFFIAPATLQMLIENAIKHNIASKRNPLQVKLFSHDKVLVVSNNLQEKVTKEESTQIGLKNIQSRYELLSDRRVEINRSEKEFRVTIPLLEIEES